MSFDFVELAKQFGPFVAFTVYFVWQGWQREKRQSARIDELANQQKETLTKLVVDSTAALAHNTTVIEQNTKIMSRMDRVISRYCDDMECDKNDDER
jgi:hypothetical protein